MATHDFNYPGIMGSRNVVQEIEKAMLHDLGRRELPGGWVSLNQSNVDSLQVFVEKSGCRFKVQN